MPIENTGIIEQQPSETDYIAGLLSPLPYEVKNPSGNWDKYLPSPEAQNSVYIDSKGCVSWSILNCIETQLNYMLATGEITKEYITEWLDNNGKLNLADRFTAKMSGTTREGNYLQKVADSLRHDGVVAEKDWNYPRDQRQPVFDWDDFYSEIPQEIKNKGKRFLEKFEISYEWVIADIPKHLKQAPLQIAIPLCQPYSNIVPACGLTQSQHAVELYDFNGSDRFNGVYSIFDSYDPFIKILSTGYPISFLMKIIIKPKKPMLKLIKETGRPETYAVLNGKPYWIRSNETLDDLVAEGVASRAEIKEQTNTIEIKGIIG